MLLICVRASYKIQISAHLNTKHQVEQDFLSSLIDLPNRSTGHNINPTKQILLTIIKSKNFLIKRHVVYF